MTSTLFAASPESPVLPQPNRRRTSRLLVIGTLLALLGGVLGWLAYAGASRGEPVTALARAVPFGATITAEDLREVTIPAGSTLRSVGWADRQNVIGLVARTDLPADQLLSPDVTSPARLPGTGDAIVGLPVGAGRLPAAGLAPRDQVVVLRPDAPGVPVRATVLGVGDPDPSGRRTVDLLVPESAIEALGTAASDDRTLLVLVAGR